MFLYCICNDLAIINEIIQHLGLQSETHATRHSLRQANTPMQHDRPWDRDVSVSDAVHLPIFFSLSAFYCSNSHSPTDPPSAPLVCPLSSPPLTNLLRIYLFPCFRRRPPPPQTNRCWAPDRERGRIMRKKQHVALERKQGGLVLVACSSRVKALLLHETVWDFATKPCWFYQII